MTPAAPAPCRPSSWLGCWRSPLQSTHMRQMMKPAALVMEAMAKVAAEHSSCSTP